MGDLFSTGSTWLESMRKEHLTHTVTYSRGATSVDVLSTKGRTAFRIVDEYGRSLIVHTVDFIFTLEDLALFVLPEVGDKITESGKIYEVLSVAGEPHYVFSSPNDDAVRVHSKEV